ncbi:GDSL-type esterase/lipase family protein [Streptomyces sp. NPDC001530]|uniref:GDSL-type esterase/lipase family protein n=1 Tax=Streptomyces sp. NPDC001530 TaxID=3364582 RepID=UPI00369FA24A
MRRDILRYARIPVTTALAVSLSAGVATTQAYAQTAPPGAADGWSAPASPGADEQPGAIPAKKRAGVLGKNYRSSKDRAFTTIGDGTGFHLLVAAEKDGYAWKTAASLSEPGFDTDTWIGNACLTQSGKYAAVAYAPRTFTNKPELMTRGAFTAVVDLSTGDVKKLPFTATLGYFSPGCGTGEQAVFTALTDDTAKKDRTRLVTVDALTGKESARQTVSGQVTSAIPTQRGIVAAEGNHLVRVAGSKVRTVVTTKTTPFQLKADADGGVTFLDREPGSAERRTTAGERATVNRVSAAQIRAPKAKARPAGLASGRLTEFDLTSTPAGEVYVTGKATTTSRAAGLLHNPGGIAKDARVSSRGQAAVTARWADGKSSRITQAEADSPRLVRTDIRALDTGKTTVVDTSPEAVALGSPTNYGKGNDLTPALTLGGKQAAPRAGATSVDTDRSCSVPRNDPKKQAFQPTPRQIEWAVDQAVVGKLNKGATRLANWKNTGMAAYAPQSLFPLRSLSGGSGADWHVPATVMLGITAQESNMWQAARMVVPGVTGNPLIGNFYGTPYAADGDQADPFFIEWAKADCGYGVTQVTDGMRMRGKEKPGETALSTTQQEAVALDYAANIAAGVNILIEKWNQTRADGIVINDGNPKYIENWFAALWTYNTGYHLKADAGKESGKWGLGWTNNPANPLWKANRTPFLEGADGGDAYWHAANPQDWPYEEKVIGWAARPISAMFKPGDFQPGYRAAWWTTTMDRTSAKPPVGLFCDGSNDCDRDKITDTDSNDTGKGACKLPGDPDTSNPLYLKCWWNKPVQWKDCTARAQCGNPVHRFDDTYPEQPDADSYPPRCNTGLPAGSMIVDDLPNGTIPAGSSNRCAGVSSEGKFELSFAYPNGRVDLHQIGAGNGNHFWFSHTRSKTGDAMGIRMYTKGTWTLNSGKRGWMRVYAHMPDHGAHTRQASYVVGGTDSKSPVRVHPQRVQENKWVDLGVFNFTGVPTVSLDTNTADGRGEEDIAWDSVAFTPLPGKPKNFVVAMGDSYSSGEGATAPGGKDYYPETDFRDPVNEKAHKEGKAEVDTTSKCHRSKLAWSRQATLPGASKSIGAMADSFDNTMDYHFVACSGARTYDVRDGSQGEVSQLDAGYLDQNTTLVTMSIGGNDARFTDVVKKCVDIPIPSLVNCQAASIPNIDPDTGKETSGETGRLDEWAPKWLHDAVRPRIANLIKAIHTKAPHAKVVLMGYPRLLEKDGSCLPALDAVEGQFINKVANTLADEMKGAASDAGTYAVFSDPRDEFAGKAICGDPESVHGIVMTGRSQADNDGPAPSMQSFHPKPAGARLYADALEHTLRGN